MPRVRMTLPMYRHGECQVLRGIGAHEIVELSPQETEILLFFLLRRSVTNEECIEWLWPDPDREPDGARSQVSLLICTLNAKLGFPLIERLHSTPRSGRFPVGGARYALAQ